MAPVFPALFSGSSTASLRAPNVPPGSLEEGPVWHVQCTRMIRYAASEARRELFRLLDSVENGEEVILERKGIRFR